MIFKSYSIILNVPAYRDKHGHLYLDRLWALDLRMHFQYINSIVLVCPVVSIDAAPKNLVPITDDISSCSISIVGLSSFRSLLSIILHFPSDFAKICRICKSADVLHTCLAGWPYPLGWIVLPVARFVYRNKFILFVVESAPWRRYDLAKLTWRAKLKEYVFEFMAKYCIRYADLVFFTQSEYQQSLMDKSSNNGHVVNASWIGSDTILNDSIVRSAVFDKYENTDARLKIIFIGRLEEQKGLRLLLDAFRHFGAHSNIDLDILGAGPLEDECRLFSENISTVRVLGTVDYNNDYFSLISKYHCIVVPTISDEQPRVIFDAFSQALPVIASNTSGNSECIKDGVNGLLFKSGSLADLIRVILSADADRQLLYRMGLENVLLARENTHEAMHTRRFELLTKYLAREHVQNSV